MPHTPRIWKSRIKQYQLKQSFFSERALFSFLNSGSKELQNMYQNLLIGRHDEESLYYVINTGIGSQFSSALYLNPLTPWSD